MNYPKAREEFIGLKHQEKKERLVRLLQIFVGNGKIFDDLINLAQKEQTSENQLIEIYESVVNAMDEVMKGNMNAMVDKLENLKKFIANLHQQEAQDRAQEDPDELLKNL